MGPAAAHAASVGAVFLKRVYRRAPEADRASGVPHRLRNPGCGVGGGRARPCCSRERAACRDGASLDSTAARRGVRVPGFQQSARRSRLCGERRRPRYKQGCQYRVRDELDRRRGHSQRQHGLAGRCPNPGNVTSEPAGWRVVDDWSGRDRSSQPWRQHHQQRLHHHQRNLRSSRGLHAGVPRPTMGGILHAHQRRTDRCHRDHFHGQRRRPERWRGPSL